MGCQHFGRGEGRVWDGCAAATKISQYTHYKKLDYTTANTPTQTTDSEESVPLKETTENFLFDFGGQKVYKSHIGSSRAPSLRNRSKNLDLRNYTKQVLAN